MAVLVLGRHSASGRAKATYVAAEKQPHLPTVWILKVSSKGPVHAKIHSFLFRMAPAPNDRHFAP